MKKHFIADIFNGSRGKSAQRKIWDVLFLMLQSHSRVYYRDLRRIFRYHHITHTNRFIACHSIAMRLEDSPRLWFFLLLFSATLQSDGEFISVDRCNSIILHISSFISMLTQSSHFSMLKSSKLILLKDW